MIAETYLDLLTDVPHWLFEVTSDVVLGALVYLPARWVFNRWLASWHRRHDQEAHGR